jgi:hypothetical protein
MFEFWGGVALGSLFSSACWWLYVRHLSGVTSDLKDVAVDLTKATAKVTAAAQTIKNA